MAEPPARSIIDLVDNLIGEANRIGASDIHIDPTDDGLRVRYRVDGVMREVDRLPSTIKEEVIGRIKVLAALRADEHQAAQDGRFRSGQIDIRVSIAPTYYGENAVLRLLTDTAEAYTLETLGFSAENQAKIIKAVNRGQGMILATGATGSGKTTTLYTLLKILNQPETAIITIEDPIEYAIANIEQIQTNQRSGLNFANGLRSILRQDPDVIMVGEIRDVETASIAINAALTGHLLLSTLHTSDAATTLPRLLDMKVEPFLVASTVSLAISQRLVRKICTNCQRQGCAECANSGYRGRVSINEVLVVDERVREAILRKASASDLRAVAIAGGMSTMLEDGEEKIATGLTSRAEVLRVIHD